MRMPLITMFMDYLYNLATDKYKGPVACAVKFFLFILSLVYFTAVRILIFFYGFSKRRLKCKVISVGNITLGGTGKTSLVEFIAGYLNRQGHKVAILSRGYKRKIRGYGIRDKGYEEMGDEPYMLSKNLGDVFIIVDSNRVKAAKTAIEKYGVDTVILDDGFQQWRIAKDLEIVTIDANNPFGNRHVLPRGILREPLSSLVRADVFILTKVGPDISLQGAENFLRRINSKAVIFQSAHKPEGFYDFNRPGELLNTDILKGKPVTLLCGIGDPASFENLIKGLGIDAGLSFRFPDHYHYTNEDLNKVINASEEKGIDVIVTTEKDMARISGFADCALRIYVLKIKLSIINDEQVFCNGLLKLYSL